MATTFTPERLLKDQWIQRRLVVPVACGVSLVVFSLIVGAILVALNQADSGLRWIPTSGKVYGVAANSPAAAAGLRPRDVIIAIDGAPRSTGFDTYAARRAGETVVLSVIRDEQPHTVSVQFTWPSMSEKLKRLSPVMVALAFGLFSFFVWAHKPYDLTVILFLAFSQLGAATLALAVLSVLYLAWTAFWFDLCFMLLSAALIHFHLNFPQPRALPRKRLIVMGLYGLVPLFFPLRWLSSQQNADSQWLSLASRIAPLYFVVTILTVVTLLTQAYHTASPPDRRRIRLVMAGTVLAYIPVVGLTILPDIFLDTTVVAHELTYPFLVFIPLTYAVAIHRHDLLRIDHLINRGVVHLTLLLSVALMYLGAMVGLPRLLPPAWADQPLVWGLITLLIGLVFGPLRDRLQAIADRLFYRGWYDYRSLMGEMSRAFSRIVDTDELTLLLVRRLAEILHVRGAALLLPTDGESLVVTEAIGDLSDVPRRSELPCNGTLVPELLHVNHPLETSELCARLVVATLTVEERNWLSQAAIKLWVPLIQQRQLQGILLLGVRAWNESFDAEDRRILGSLAWQAGITVANVRMVEALRRRAHEVRQLYSQLVQSREVERKHLAREIHDQIIQDLINLHYALDRDTPGVELTVNMQALHQHLHRAIANLRRVCTELRPEALDDLSLSLAMQGYAEEVRATYGLDVELRVAGDEDAAAERLPEMVSLSLFRVFQEAVTNARRHAYAGQVRAALRLAANHVILEVRDDGRGFDCPADMGRLIRAGHFGLAGAHERTSLLGGTLHVESAPGRGTTVRAYVPLKAQEGDAPAEQ